jgi:predicted ester cyclase
MTDTTERAELQPGHEHIAALEAALARWNAGDLEGYLQLYDPAAVVHGYPGVEPGLASIRAFYQGFWAAFPGSQLRLEDTVAAADKVAVRATLSATHGGPFMGLPATGRAVTLPTLTILRYAGGRCVERWSQADFLGLLQQLGAFPAPGAAG